MLTMLLSPQSRQLETYLLLRGGGEWPLDGISMEELQAGVAQYVMQDDYYASEEALAMAREMDEIEENARKKLDNSKEAKKEMEW